jgi:hypothetical protein
MRVVNVFVMLSLLAGCASTSRIERLPQVSEGECAVVAAWARDLVQRENAFTPSDLRTELSKTARGWTIQAGQWRGPSEVTLADARMKTRSARLDGCNDLSAIMSGSSWVFVPPTRYRIGGVRSVVARGVSRVGLNSEATEAVIDTWATTVEYQKRGQTQIYSEGQALLYRKDPQTGVWRQTGRGPGFVE